MRARRACALHGAPRSTLCDGSPWSRRSKASLTTAASSEVSSVSVLAALVCGGALAILRQKLPGARGAHSVGAFSRVDASRAFAFRNDSKRDLHKRSRQRYTSSLSFTDTGYSKACRNAHPHTQYAQQHSSTKACLELGLSQKRATHTSMARGASPQPEGGRGGRSGRGGASCCVRPTLPFRLALAPTPLLHAGGRGRMDGAALRAHRIRVRPPPPLVTHQGRLGAYQQRMCGLPPPTFGAWTSRGSSNGRVGARRQVRLGVGRRLVVGALRHTRTAAGAHTHRYEQEGA